MLRLASLALATHAAAAADACVARAALRDQWTATGSVDVDAAETEACGDAEAARAPYDRDRELSIQMLLPDSLWFGAEGVVEHLPILKTPQRAGVELCHSFAAAGSAETLAEACEPASEKLRPRKHRFGAAGRYVFRAWLTGARARGNQTSRCLRGAVCDNAGVVLRASAAFSARIRGSGRPRSTEQARTRRRL